MARPLRHFHWAPNIIIYHIIIDAIIFPSGWYWGYWCHLILLFDAIAAISSRRFSSLFRWWHNITFIVLHCWMPILRFSLRLAFDITLSFLSLRHYYYYHFAMHGYFLLIKIWLFIWDIITLAYYDYWCWYIIITITIDFHITSLMLSYLPRCSPFTMITPPLLLFFFFFFFSLQLIIE